MTASGAWRSEHRVATASGASYAELFALDREHVMQTYGRQPVAFVRGEGARLWDSDGREYLDFLTGLATVSLGHAHPVVADAIAEQARTLVHVSNLYLNDVQPRLARRLDLLLTSATGTPGRVFFGNSGAEANECAIKLARRYGQSHGGPERYHVLSAYNSFHGRTLTTLAATGQPQKQETFQPLPSGFRHFAFADLDALRAGDGRAGLRGPARARPGRGRRPARPGRLPGVGTHAVRRAGGAARDRRGADRAGAHRALVRLRARGRRAARRRDDGEGARQRHAHRGVLGAGRRRRRVPARRPRLDVRRPATRGAGRARGPRRHGAGERARALALAQGRRLVAALRSVPGVADVRGLGLLLAAELDPGLDAVAVAAAALEAGLVLNAVTPTSLRLAPPLLVTEAEIDRAVELLTAVLDPFLPGGRS